MAFAAVVALLVGGPLLVLVGALFRALLLFWPTMILLGAVHSYIPAVPALGWQASFLVVALLSVLVPVSTSASSD